MKLLLRVEMDLFASPSQPPELISSERQKAIALLRALLMEATIDQDGIPASDRRVQDGISLVFRKFAELQSASLQLASNQAIVGIDGVVLAARPGGLVLGLLNGIFDLLALVALGVSVGLHCGMCGLDTEWLQPVNNLLRDGSIYPHAAKSDAVADRFGAKRTAADVSLCIAAFASVLRTRLMTLGNDLARASDRPSVCIGRNAQEDHQAARQRDHCRCC